MTGNPASAKPFYMAFAQNTGVLNGTQAVLIIPNTSHVGSGLIYQTPVNDQAFVTSFTFVPDGWNISFTMNNNTNSQAGGAGNIFSAGAGCEGSFYQGFSQ